MFCIALKLKSKSNFEHCNSIDNIPSYDVLRVTDTATFTYTLIHVAVGVVVIVEN